MAQDYEHTLRLRLVRLNLMNEGLLVKAPKGYHHQQSHSQTLESGFEMQASQMAAGKGWAS